MESKVKAFCCFPLQESVATLMSLLADCVSSMKKEDIKIYQSNLFSLFLVALDFRIQHNQEVRFIQ